MSEIDTLFMVDGNEFDIDSHPSATGLSAIISPEIDVSWNVDVSAKEKEIEEEGYSRLVSPSLNLGELGMSSEIEKNTRFHWPHATCYQNDGWIGSFYYSDAYYFECRLTLERLAVDRFLLTMSGKVDFTNQHFEGGNFRPLEIRTPLKFFGIEVREYPEAEARKICSRYLDIEDLRWTTLENGHNALLV